MRVEVKLRGALADRLPGGQGPLDLPDDADTGQILSALGLPPMPCVFVVNGAATAGRHRLGEGDRVEVHPAIAGG